MLTLLRKIRRSLVGAGAVGKPTSTSLSTGPSSLSGGQGGVVRYLIYAFGEIALIVIGILIALQINNWNEAQKSKIERINTLTLMVTELRQDIAFYEDLINNNIERIDFLIALSKEEYHSVDLTTIAFKISKNFDPRNFGTSFHSLKEKGQLNKLENKDLQEQIVKYYEDICVNYNNLSEWHRKFVAENIDNYILENLYMDPDGYVKSSVVLKEMEGNKLPSIINFQAVILKRFNSRSTDNLRSANDLISRLNQAINK